jgi:hypothetical protein
MEFIQDYVAHTLRTMLQMPWAEMPACKLGIISESGKLLRTRESLTTDEERKAYPSLFYTLAWNLKRLMESDNPSGAQIALRGIRLTEYCRNELGSGDFVEEILHEELDSRSILSTVLLEDAQPKAIQPGNYYIRGIGKHEVKEAILPCEEFFGHPIYRIGKTMFTIEDVQQEDAPTNAVGTGNIAGVSPGQEPPGRRGKFFRRNVKKTKELKRKMGL